MTEAIPPRLRRFSNEATVLLVSIAVIAIATFVAVAFLPEPLQQRQSIFNRQGDGTTRLRDWFEETGFDVQRITADPVDPTPYDVIFVLNPPGSHNPQEVDALYQWVREGGKLIVASETLRVNDLLAPYKTEISPDRSPIYRLPPAAPTLLSPVVGSVPINFAPIVETQRPDAVVHLAHGTDAVLISFREGEGEVFVTGAVFPFTNNGIRSEGSAPMIANIMGGTTPGETVIGFDEAQLPAPGDNQQTSPSILAWLARSTAGRGVLLFGGVMLVYLLSYGRRFGAPVPLPENRLRREPVEYIVAIANLFRRSGRRTETMQHYKSRLRRHLSERYTIDPYLRDEQFAREAALRASVINEQELLNLLHKLSKDNPTEADLLSAASAVDVWLRR